MQVKCSSFEWGYVFASFGWGCVNNTVRNGVNDTKPIHYLIWSLNFKGSSLTCWVVLNDVIWLYLTADLIEQCKAQNFSS